MNTMECICCFLPVLLALSDAFPVERRSPESVNPFDTGPLNSCSIPTASQLPACAKYINYPVPQALLNETIAGIIEKAVAVAKENAVQRETVGGDEDMASGCGIAVEELECYRRFPPCTNGNSEVDLTVQNQNCKSNLSTACTEHESLSVTTCRTSPVQAVVELATCTKVSSTAYNYKHCSSLQGWSDVYMTQWMNVSIINAERDIDDFQKATSAKGCVSLYAELKCGEVGQCWNQGTRMEINSTRELCKSVLECVSSSVRKLLEKQINCSLYPGKDEKLATPATEITPPPTSPPRTEPTSSMNASTESVTVRPTGDDLSGTTPPSHSSRPPLSVDFVYPAEATDSACSCNRSLLSLTVLLLVTVLLYTLC